MPDLLFRTLLMRFNVLLGKTLGDSALVCLLRFRRATASLVIWVI